MTSTPTLILVGLAIVGGVAVALGVLIVAGCIVAGFSRALTRTRR